MNKVLIVKDFSSVNCNNFIYCNPFYTINCIDKNITSLIVKAEKLLITSKNSIMALINNIAAFNCNFHNKEIIVVGSKTHELLVRNGFTNIADPYYDIQSLVAKVHPTQVLYLSGFHTSFLNYKDYGIKREIVYKAIECKIPLEIINQVMNGDISNILLYSRRGAAIFLKNFPEGYNFHGINFICISKSVSEIVGQYNHRFPNIPIESEMLTLIS